MDANKDHNAMRADLLKKNAVESLGRVCALVDVMEGGEFSACTNVFFRLRLVHEFFFSGETLCTNFFSHKYCFLKRS